MPYLDDDDSAEDLDDRELPDPSDSNEDEETQPCPHCGKKIYDDAERCSACGKYVDDGARPRKPMWFIIAAIVCLLIVIGWILLRL